MAVLSSVLLCCPSTDTILLVSQSENLRTFTNRFYPPKVLLTQFNSGLYRFAWCGHDVTREMVWLRLTKSCSAPSQQLPAIKSFESSKCQGSTDTTGAQARSFLCRSEAISALTSSPFGTLWLRLASPAAIAASSQDFYQAAPEGIRRSPARQACLIRGPGRRLTSLRILGRTCSWARKSPASSSCRSDFLASYNLHIDII